MGDAASQAAQKRAPTPAPPRSNTLAPEERAAAKRSSGPVIGILVLLVLALGGGVVWLVLNRLEAAKRDEVQPPVALTEGVDAPNALSLGGGKRLAKPPEEVIAPKPPEVVPVVAVLRAVQVDSLPKGATVWLGETKVGRTPLSVQLNDGEKRTYRFTLKGYVTKEEEVASTASAVAVKLEKRARGGKKPVEEADPYGKIDDLKANPFK